MEIANRIGQLETNIVTERTARMDADYPGASLVDKADRHEDVKKAWQAGRICEGWVERLGAGHVVQHRNLMNAMKDSAARETHVMNVGLTVSPQHDCSSTLRFLHMMTTTGKALDGKAGEGEGISRAAGLMQELLAFEFTSDAAFFELFDNKCWASTSRTK